MQPSEVLVSAMETPFGTLLAATRDDVVVATSGPIPGRSEPLAWGRWRWPGDAVCPAGSAHRHIRRQIREYFAGSRQSFALPIELAGLEAHVRAWQAATAIPYGKCSTYGEIAMEIGMPGAARFVGRAMSMCQVPLFIPCHRVVGAGGKRCGDVVDWQRREALLGFERDQLTAAAARL